jgi:threonine dehydratase
MAETPLDLVNRERIEAVERLIRPYIRRTPVVEIDGRDFDLDSGAIVLKLELLQHSGSFKVRGTFANLLMREVPKAGVVAASGGNHGVAVAYAARKRNVPAKIFLPSISSPAKIQRIRDYGADLVVGGERYADALAASEAWAAQSGALPIHAFDQTETLLGQGTLGLELQAQAPALDTLLVAVGGGGLIGGIAAWYAGSIAIVGVEPEASPTLAKALEAGRPVDAPTDGIAADSLAPKRVGERGFPIAQCYVERVVLVSDDAIAKAQEILWSVTRIVTEPGGATAFAALMSGRYRPRSGERVGIVLCGANTTAVDFSAR